MRVKRDGRALIVTLLCLACGSVTAAAQDAPVREVGGRLVATAETVVVAGDDADAPTKDSSIATKVDTPLLETPRSITIVDRQTLDDLSAINITKAHDYTVGMTPQDERGPGFARGFPVDFYDLRRDGLRTYSWSIREPVALDRIQYLRGPASVLYGDGSPGALVNLVLKKPLPVKRLEFAASGGGVGFGRLTGDATGPFNQARTARYRVIASGEWLANGFDNGERRFSLLPSVAVDLNPGTTLSFDTEVYRQRGRNYRHAVPATAAAQRGDFSDYPWDLSIASPDDTWSGGNVAPGVRLDARLGERSTFHAAARYTHINGDLDLQALASLAPDGQTALRYHYREISRWNEYQSDVFATTRVRTGVVEHKLVAGIEAGVSTTDSQIGVGPAAPLDIHNPVYAPASPIATLSPVLFDVTRLGLYVLDQIQLSRHVTIVPGLRWSRTSVDDQVAAAQAGATEFESEDTVVSPNLGVVVQPRPWFTVYSTTQGFEPPAPGQYLEGGLAPALSENWAFETGTKADVLKQRMSVSAAAFRIVRTNVPEADPRGFYRQIGEGTSHGLELEAVGAVAAGLTARAGYAWTETDITRDALGGNGRDLPNAPRHKANLWMRYRFSGGTARGVMVAAGVLHEAQRFTARDNIVVAPAYTRLDATASWELSSRRLVLGVVAENLTDVRYVRSGNGGIFFAGPPRRLAAQLTSSF
jgi:iron complex outermembrane receptor protein